MYDYHFEGDRRITYAGGAVFVPKCACGRYVKPDATVRVGEQGLADEPNATCSRCGRVEMYFEGFFGEDELS